MKYVHVFALDSNQKFSLPYIEFIQKNFNSDDHYFYLTLGRNEVKPNSNQKNLGFLSYDIFGTKELMNKTRGAEKVFYHGLSKNKYVYLALFLQPWILKKSYWAIWGMGLYFYERKKEKFSVFLIELMRKFIIKNFRGIITHLKGDYELAKKWYGFRGEYFYSFMYPSNLYKEIETKKNMDRSQYTYIQIGNSGGESNYHLEVFDKLSKYKENPIKIVCPLSYSGNKEYVDDVIKKGYEIFGEEKFIPYTDFMSFDEYVKLLEKIDIAIFNHRRQRGLGNITTLLGMGKKVYLRKSITTWQFCKDHGLKVFNAENEFNDLFEPISREAQLKNRTVMKEDFSEKKLINDWKKIFEGN